MIAIGSGPLRSLRGLAWLNVALHFAALATAAVGMRPGTPLVSLPERLEYLSGAPLGWKSGWALWMLCTAALIAFLAAVVHHRNLPEPLTQIGLTIAIVGAGFDLLCDSVYLLLFPKIASTSSAPHLLFLTIEQTTGIGSLVVANGSYSVGILLIALAYHKRGMTTLPVTMLGILVAGFGFLLAAAGFTGVPWHAEWAMPPTIGFFCLWSVLVARSLERARRRD